ncbi:60S ribosomal protein L20 [Metarhizium anisopliae]|nr:60S ribosomal protein L20 [Metarhizium anisopliae]
MDLRSLARPVAQLLTTARRTPLTPKRGHKTTARTKRALKIAPHDSFLPDRTAASPPGDSIIYNPPRVGSLACPHALPLPPAQRPAQPPTDADMPPRMRYKHRKPRYNLQKEDVAEMKRLRAEDPIEWSVARLSQKFECSEVFVKMAAPAPQEHIAWLKGKMDRKTARWGPMKAQAREDRKRRADLVYRGDL